MSDYFKKLAKIIEDQSFREPWEFNRWLMNYAPQNDPETIQKIMNQGSRILGCGEHVWILVSWDGNNNMRVQYHANSRSTMAICKIISDAYNGLSPGDAVNLKIIDFHDFTSKLDHSKLKMAQKIINRLQESAKNKT